MSANLSIVTHDNPEAVVLPPEAVREGAEGRVVPVTIGISTPEGVEVRGALAAGDVILR